VSCGGDGNQLLVARAAAWRARGRPAGGAKAVGELGGDAWSGAGAGKSLARHGTRACGGAVARQRRRQRRKKEGGRWWLICKFRSFRDLTVNQNSPLF
jgi:hypothetical protein